MNLTIEQAFSVVSQALEGANQGQRFSLKDSATIFTALGTLANHLQVEVAEQGAETSDPDAEVKKAPSVKKVK